MKSGKKWVLVWLYLGLIMIFVQFVIGGFTRLTDSGLSITEWNVIKGVIPPIGHSDWTDAFTKYKLHASQQFESLHADMSLAEFKGIYYWEWFHRLWARMMGFVFVIPLTFFVLKGWISKKLGWRLAFVFFLAACAGLLGWIMVKSGLNNDERTWVSAYKLISHLGIGVLLLGYLYWVMLKERVQKRVSYFDVSRYRYLSILLILLVIQILFGGLMAGMKAALLFPFYPLLNEFGLVLESILLVDISSEFVDYEASIGIKALVQTVHRGVGLLFLTLSIFYIYFYRLRVNMVTKFFVGAVSLQYILGILTAILSKTHIPVMWGVLHQAMALIVLLLLLEILYEQKNTCPKYFINKIDKLILSLWLCTISSMKDLLDL